MQIRRETDYAIHCVLHLSDEPNRVVLMDTIARDCSIPRNFLAKILQKLVRAGLVKSYRGIKGGFQLTRSPGKISLLDVIKAVEGSVAMNRCAFDKRLCDLSNACSVHPVWVELRGKVETYLRRVNFHKLTRMK